MYKLFFYLFHGIQSFKSHIIITSNNLIVILIKEYYDWEEFKMKHNNSIGCSVNECKYHCKEDPYCTLDQIMVTKNKPEARTSETTDCASFECEC